MLNIGSACCAYIGILRSSSELIRWEKKEKEEEEKMKKRILEFLALADVDLKMPMMMMIMMTMLKIMMMMMTASSVIPEAFTTDGAAEEGETAAHVSSA